MGDVSLTNHLISKNIQIRSDSSEILIHGIYVYILDQYRMC
jgi:hypothetical protein